MSLLNLRGEDSVPEPDNEVVLPETPPGLDAIRAWIQKPRPWLRGIRLWIDHIRTEGPATWKLLRERGLRAARWLRRVLGRIAPATRPVVELGQIIGELGEMICRVADELHDLLGKQTETGTQFREVGRIAQRAGVLIVSTTRLSGKALTQLGRLLALLTALEAAPEPAPPPEPPKPDPAPPRVPKPDPRPDEGPVDGHPEPQPGPTPPDGSGRAPSESATPVPAPHAPAGGTRGPVPPTPPDPTPAPDPRGEPAPKPDPSPRPEPTSEPDPDPSPPTPAPPPSEPAPAIPSEADLEARLEGVPDVLLPQVRAAVLKGRSPRDVLHPLILEICYRRDWTTAKQLARWLDMHQASLTERHLGPLVRDGLLELKYPDRPSSPRQAYRTCRDRWPPRQ